MNRLIVKVGKRHIFLNCETIDWCEATGNYVRIASGGSTYLLRRSMAELERILGDDRFVRINRSVIVNIDRIREIRSQPPRAMAVVLDGERSWWWGKTYRPKLRKLLQQSLL